MKVRLIIQGPYYCDDNISTLMCIKSALDSKLFSSICLSTYDTPELEEIRHHNIEIIINNDPGCESYDPYRQCYNNNNRQTVSLASAVLEGKFDITIKIRSDSYIKDFKMLKSVLEDFMSSSKDFLFCDTTSVDYKIFYQKILFHLSDWVIGFKSTQDTIMNSLPLENEKKDTDWVLNLTGPLKKEFHDKQGSTRYGTEQWIILNIFHRDSFPIEHSYDYSESAKALYEDDLERVMCVPLYKMGMRSMKYPKIHYPHYDRYENYLGKYEKLIYKLIGTAHKLITFLYKKQNVID